MLAIEMLSTGDEVLYGQIVDTNAAWLADYLFNHGLLLSRRSTVGDNVEQLTAILQERSLHADVLIVNGGLGPTSDDLSAAAAAKAANDKLVEYPEWIEAMERYFTDRGRVMAASNRKQACIPSRSILVDNPVGTACGFMLRLNRCLMFFTPGVPFEFKKMVSDRIVPTLIQQGLTSVKRLCLRMTTFGRSESELAQRLDTLTLPEDVTLGYRSAMPIIELKLTGPETLRPQMESAWQEVRRVAGESALYEGTEPLSVRLSRKILEHNWRLVICEQFSGGRLAEAFSDESGPLVWAEVRPPQQETLGELLKRVQDLRSYRHGDIALAVGCENNGRIRFALVTPTYSVAVKVAFGFSRHAKTIQREVAALQAMNMLRCWLNGWSLSTSHGWITVEESVIKSGD